MVWMLCVKLITKAKIANISPHIFMEAVYYFLLYTYFYKLVWVHFWKKHKVSPFSDCLFMYAFLHANISCPIC